MSPLFTCIVIIMGLLAVMGIVVGVANDAVNFLNSALGSKAAPRRVILWIAAAGILLVSMGFPGRYTRLLGGSSSTLLEYGTFGLQLVLIDRKSVV